MRRPQRTPDDSEHHDDAGDPAMRGLNRLGLVVAALFAAFLYFLWSHPNYEPVCISGYRSRCGPTLRRSSPPEPLPPESTPDKPTWTAPLPRAVRDLPAPPLSQSAIGANLKKVRSRGV